MIPGVEIKQLTTHQDDRGFFREIIRASDPFFDGFGQLSDSMKKQDYFTPEFHIHQHQTDWWYVPTGTIRAVLCDLREETDKHEFQKIMMGVKFPVVLKIPPGVAHGFKVLLGPAHLIYVTSREYDRDDEGRVILDYDWNRPHIDSRQ